MTPEQKRAVRHGDVEALDRLLAAGADVDAKDEHGQTSLMIAATHGQLDVVRLLLIRHPNLDHTAKYHLTALMLATINGHVEIVEALVRADADQTIRGTGAPGFYDRTALDLARGPNRDALVAALQRGV